MKRTKKLLTLIFALTCIFTFLSCSQKEEEFPSKNVTVIIPNAPGGGTDRSVRGILEVAKKYSKVNFIAENRPGAATAIGTSAIANAKADGYTIGTITVESVILPHVGQMPVDYTAFKPLAFTIGEPSVLTIKTDDKRFSNLKEFIEYAKANPGKLKVGTSGVNSIWYIGALLLKESLGIDFTIIPYESGSSDTVAALVGGHIDATTVGPGNVKNQVDANVLKSLAILTEERSPLFPDLPTIVEEANIEPFTIRAWALMVCPAKVSDEIYNYWNDVFTKASQDEEFKNFLNMQGLIMPIGMENAEEVLKSDNELYKRVIESIQQ